MVGQMWTRLKKALLKKKGGLIEIYHGHPQHKFTCKYIFDL